MTTENGFRGYLCIRDFHDGPAGFQYPSMAQKLSGATLVAACRPNIGKRLKQGTATVNGQTYRVVGSFNSRTAGFVIVLLAENN
jgi:hypothetical protein